MIPNSEIDLKLLIQHTDETIEKPVRRDNFVRAFAAVVNRLYSDPDVSLEVVAAELELSQRTVQRKLKDFIEMSFSQYVSEIRFYHARKHLIQGERVSRIAQKVGFSSHAYFSASFKKFHYESPKSWQLKNRVCFEPAVTNRQFYSAGSLRYGV